MVAVVVLPIAVVVMELLELLLVLPMLLPLTDVLMCASLCNL